MIRALNRIGQFGDAEPANRAALVVKGDFMRVHGDSLAHAVSDWNA